MIQWQSDSLESLPALFARELAVLLKTAPLTWFISGGSNVALEAQTLQLLADNGAQLSNLTVLLIDERFGPVGHPDSNWQQLLNAGFMVDGPTYIEPFTTVETSLDQAVGRYAAQLTRILAQPSYRLALLGMGDDGHTSGILPGSPATTAAGLVYGYDWPPYQRLTTTFEAIKQLDEVILVAYGESKWPQLERLSQSINPAEQPVQIIKDSNLATIYTDYQPK